MTRERKRRRRRRRSAKRRKENLVNHPYPRLGKVKAGAEVAPSLQNQKDEENTAPSHHENEAKVKEIKNLRAKNYSSSTKKLVVVTLISRNKSYCRLEVVMMLLMKPRCRLEMNLPLWTVVIVGSTLSRTKPMCGRTKCRKNER